MKKEAQNIIYEGTNLAWESYKLEAYVIRASQFILNMQEKVDELMVTDSIIEGYLNTLTKCEYDYRLFSEIIEKIQKCVDELSLRMYSNISNWVVCLNRKVKKSSFIIHFSDYKVFLFISDC